MNPYIWLSQISGNFGVAKDALAEIASRLRVRTLRDANAGSEPGPVGPAGPVQGFGPARSLAGRGPLPSGTMGASSSGAYEPFRVIFFSHFILSSVKYMFICLPCNYLLSVCNKCYRRWFC